MDLQDNQTRLLYQPMDSESVFLMKEDHDT